MPLPRTEPPTEAEIQAALEKLKWEQERLNWAIETAKKFTSSLATQVEGHTAFNPY